LSASVSSARPANALFAASRVLAAGANPHRLLILQLLSRTARTTTELAGVLEITAAAVSQHLKVLAETQLVLKQRRGREVLYALRRSGPDVERLLAAVPEILR
jgi:DNA-binding transcriptional ArsR family regulator